jgi:hypothetical protein
MAISLADFGETLRMLLKRDKKYFPAITLPTLVFLSKLLKIEIG